MHTAMKTTLLKISNMLLVAEVSALIEVFVEVVRHL